MPIFMFMLLCLFDDKTQSGSDLNYDVVAFLKERCGGKRNNQRFAVSCGSPHLPSFLEYHRFFFNKHFFHLCFIIAVTYEEISYIKIYLLYMYNIDKRSSF